jgi:hypothetical protein
MPLISERPANRFSRAAVKAILVVAVALPANLIGAGSGRALFTTTNGPTWVGLAFVVATAFLISLVYIHHTPGADGAGRNWRPVVILGIIGVSTLVVGAYVWQLPPAPILEFSLQCIATGLVAAIIRW